MTRRCLSLLTLASMTLTAVAAAPLERDLGYGLIYVRTHELPQDLPEKPVTGRVPPCVVDLRYVRAEGESAAAFLAWLKLRATPRSPVFVLANGETAPALLKPLAQHERAAGILVVGIPSNNFQPDVIVNG